VLSASNLKFEPISKIVAKGSGQGTERIKSGAYTQYVSILIRSVTQPWALRRIFEMGSIKNLYMEENIMASMDEQILRATKEIVVKFIEGGRISPTGFHDAFKGIYNTVNKTVKDSMDKPAAQKKEDKENAENAENSGLASLRRF
jgi:hypothetical protein